MAVSATAWAADRPNVLLVMTDDQGWGDIRSHGNARIDTPMMDGLAAAGARFERFFVSPVCAPTRASLLTGRYHLRTGTHGVTRAAETMREREVTVAEMFEAAGYATGCFGKWHNGAHYPQHPNGQGFDEFFGFCAGHWNNYFDTTLERNGTPVKTNGYISDVLTDVAIAFIEKNKKGPFFCYVPYNAPHTPWQVEDRYFDKYRARGLDDKTACAYAMCENLDDNLGRLLNTLDRLDLAAETIVLFLTDNGPNTERYNGDMKGRKGSPHEGGIRVPLFVRWPGRVRPGLRIEPIAAHVDLLPTLAELCRVPMLDHLPLDGKSLAPLLEEKPIDWPDRRLFTFRNRRGSVRTQRWRAIGSGDKWELYDMRADPAQTSNLAADHPDLTQELSRAWRDMYQDVTRDGLDYIPTQVGHPGWPLVTLPGHEALLRTEKREIPPGSNRNRRPTRTEGISYLGRSGWANDWITNWTRTDCYPWWQIDVVRPGRYEVTLMYCCPATNVGSRLRVEVADRTLEGVVDKPHDPEPIPSPDRVARGEAYEKVWAPLTLGSVELPEGQAKLVIRALKIAGKQAPDIKAVQLRRMDPIVA